MKVGTRLMLKSKLNYLVDFITWLPLLALKTSASLSQKRKINFEIKESQPREPSSAFLSQRGREALLYVFQFSPAHNYCWGSFIFLLCPAHCKTEDLALKWIQVPTLCHALCQMIYIFLLILTTSQYHIFCFVCINKNIEPVREQVIKVI